MKKSGQFDFTKGPILMPMLKFGLPVLFSSIFQLLYNTVDTVVIGHTLGDISLAAIGSVAAVFEMLTGLVMGLSQGISISVGRSFGSGDGAKLRRASAASLIIGGTGIFLLTVLGFGLLKPLMHLLNTPENVFQEAYEYISIIVLFSGVMFAYNLCAGVLRAIGNSLMPLVFLIISSCLNVVLDIVFIVYLDFGVSGAAIATIISQGVSVAACVVYILRRAQLLIPGKGDFVFDKKLYSDTALQSLALGLMDGIVYAGSAILQSAVNSLGYLVVAGHTASRRLFLMFLTIFGAVNTTVNTFVSQNHGADRGDRIIKAVKLMYITDAVITLAIMAIIIPGARFFVQLLSGSSEAVVLDNASRYLRFVAPFYFVLGILNISRISLQAIGQKVLPIVSSVIELIGKIIFVVIFIPKFGYSAVIVCEPVIWCFMVTELLISFWCNPYIRKARRAKNAGQQRI